MKASNRSGECSNHVKKTRNNVQGYSDHCTLPRGRSLTASVSEDYHDERNLLENSRSIQELI